MNRDKNKHKNRVVLDQSIIKQYEKYKHPGSNVKKQVLQGYHFEIDDNYDIIDTGILKETKESGIWCIWNRSCSKRHKGFSRRASCSNEKD